ncbi:brefeldin A-inhibited guanine nucleotide-exchange protein 3-like isoform X2 [Mya arenaria]|uniref:brefeldin A-inhibited guanine nucleotide-exchange protein 3-like isoform X2 n=1 Tax=Mya arenaria TaxID=6604 RepID=UPI0022E17C37|nr:brefeldin A-inhibited guanine nucleotide-exchange protein 3-like isoform X2 [Mya arenaria]
MEDLLRLLIKDAQAPKFQPVRVSAQNALDTLTNPMEADVLPAYELRERCLEAMQLALESRTKRLMMHGLSGIEKLLRDSRFHASLEPANEEKWLPLQVLNTVYAGGNLPEEIQADVIKLLLKMTLSSAWCTNTKIVTKISEVFIDTYTLTASSASVRGLVQAALTQLLASFSEKLCAAIKEGEKAEHDVMSDFNAKGETVAESLMSDIVSMLFFLCERINISMKAGQTRLAVPVLLEGVLAILKNAPSQLRIFDDFQQHVWQNLCPTLISLLGVPKTDTKLKLTTDPSKNVDTTALSPTSAKIIYGISVELCKMLGPVESLRPVLESLFHRILTCTAPQHRHDAIKAVRELLNDPGRLCDITVTHCMDGKSAGKSSSKCNELAMLKMFMKSIQECCHTNDSALCFTSVLCVHDLLTSIQQMEQGIGIHDNSVKVIEEKYTHKQESKRALSERTNSMASQSDTDDGLVNTNNSNICKQMEEHIDVINSRQSSIDLDKNSRSDEGQTINDTSNKLDNPSQNYEEARVEIEGGVSTDCVVNSDNNDKVGDKEQPQEAKKESVTADVKNMSSIDTKVKERSRSLEGENGPVFVDHEKQSALKFIEELKELVPDLLSRYFSIPDVDEGLQQFASKFAEKSSSPEKPGSTCGTPNTMLNADSIYSTSYAVLCLALHLHTNDYYTLQHRSLIPLTESEFQDSVLDTDMFLYLSPDWLSHVYQTVVSQDILAHATDMLLEDSALVWTLREMPIDDMFEIEEQSHDIDGDGSHALGGQMLKDCVQYELEETVTAKTSPEARNAGKLLAGQILSTCWESILDILANLLSGRSVIGVTNSFAVMIGMEGAKEEALKKRDALCKCLDGLQIAAKLCCTLGLQERCEAVFTLLANTSCVMEDFIHANQPSPGDRTTPKSQSKQKLVTLHAAHVLSMDAMMTTGLEIGSHSAVCWKQVFRCCAFISELEHTYFSGGNNQSNLPKIQQEAQAVNGEESENDIYSDCIPMGPIVPVAPRINVSSLVAQSCLESGWDIAGKSGAGELNSVQASQALCGLSQQVDRIFEEAASNLNMTALTGFLANLCESSKHQLQKWSKKLLECEDQPGDQPVMPVNSLHLYRLQGVVLKVAHSDRPLIHIVKAWSVVSSYLVESAGHKDRSISKMAVTCVHDFVIAVMSRWKELRHFHTNEMLCKTFENILCLELCDGDVQDQIVCSICELVEASAMDIKSGWRPLFGALRAVRIEYTTVEEVNEARQRHVEAVLDVFDVFLNTDNILVFANATVDCILCLLKYVRGPGEFSDSDSDESDSEMEYVSSSPCSENLVLPALQYLKQCSIILQSMWKMPACPVFHGAKRIQVDTFTRCVDPVIANMDFDKFSAYFTPANVEAPLTSSKETLGINEEKRSGDTVSLLSNDSGIHISDEGHKTKQSSDDKSTTLDELDKHTGILHVWFLLLEGVSGAMSSCPRSFQPHTMETLFELLRTACLVPGPDFVVFCIKHLLLPMIQSWSRSGSKKFGYWDTGATNFKQCCGHTTDLIVDLIHDFKDNNDLSYQLEVVLRQTLAVLAECVSQPTEVISRLGCSCIRHILLSGHEDFSERMWDIMITSIEQALNVTTYNLRQIMLLFHPNSENFYGDIGQVKVATRKDCTLSEFVRVWHLAQQVFLLDSQVSVELPIIDDTEDKSYVFLLYPPGYENSLNPDHILARVPFRSLVVGLLSHQLLLQTIGCILLEGNTTAENSCMPGMLSQLSSKQVVKLLTCLRSSYQLACDFDLRPGLKFLMQKVAHTPVSVNLYKQAGASMVFYIHTLIKICSNLKDIDKASVQEMLTEQKDREDQKSGDNDSREKGTIIEGKENYGKEMEPRQSNDGTKYVNEGENGFVVKEGMETEAKHDEQTTEQNERNSATSSFTDLNGASKCQTMCISSLKGPAVTDNAVIFINELKGICDELCHTYIEILYDKSGTSCVDSMSEQQLFFLIAQPDEFPEMPSTKLDINTLSKQLEQTQARLEGQSIATQVVSIQEEPPVTIPTETKPNHPKPRSEEQTKSKRELRNENESRVYNLATDKLIKNLMTEYKKRKNQNAMPTFSKVNTKTEKKKKVREKKTSGSIDSIEQVIERQQQTSIMKDSEAHLQSWTELLCTILGLFHQLSDSRFTTLLPTVFGAVNHMICHAHDMRLREELAQWLHRVGRLYNIGLEGESIKRD